MQDAPDEFLARWNLTMIEPIARTGHADVWKVKTANGTLAALKIFRRFDMGNEGPGIRLLQGWHDRGAVRVLADAQNAVLMEWLKGPSLGDISREGRPEDAIAMLADAARQLHQRPSPPIDGLVPLETVLASFFSCHFAAACAVSLRQDMTYAQGLARSLLETQPMRIPLHGDLHHDNVIMTSVGLRVFDAKGYVGDPAFELANALRNPKGMRNFVRQRRHIESCLTLYSDALSVARDRLAKWAATKCAVSIFWRSGGTITHDPEADLLNLLLHAAGQ